MSWIFALNQHPDSFVKISSACHDTPFAVMSASGFYLAIGGNPDTCFWEGEPENSKGWAVVGTGISRSATGVHILTQSDWEKLLSQKIFDLTALDGHFVVLRWNRGSIECFTDQIGLRTLYCGKYPDGICISTRLDWLARATGNSVIDFTTLGSRWMLQNQLSYGSCVSGVDRIGPGGYAIISDGRIENARNTLLTPDFNPDLPQKAVEILKMYLKCAMEHRYTPSLGLSGGLDSRLLLALLLSSPTGRFVTHTFGNCNNPDVRIADRIASALRFPHHYFHESLPDVDTCISYLRDYVSQVVLTEPCSSYVNLRYYRNLRESHRIMIDGGFGEIARRQFLNRVVLLGRLALKFPNFALLYRLLHLSRADIFSDELKVMMKEGSRRDLEIVISEMPSIDEIGIENFADLFTVRMRIPNYGGPEQSRLDSEILNFMPYAQPSFIRAVFRMPVGFRKNASIHRKIISDLQPALMGIPLVKSGFEYKFGINKYFVSFKSKLNSKISQGYCDPEPEILFNHLKEFILDIAHSKNVTSVGIYDTKKIPQAILNYYKGDRSLEKTVDWWLTFELWRRSLSIKIY